MDSPDSTVPPMIAEARQILAAALRSAIADQEAGRHLELADRYDDVYTEILPLTDGVDPLSGRALDFWDAWGDAARHDWRYYDGIERSDWPRMATALIWSLEEGWPVTDPQYVNYFERSRPSFWQRLFRPRDESAK